MKFGVHFLRILTPALRPFEAAGGHLPALQAHSSPHSHQLSARHRQIAQGKQRDQLSRVLGQSFVAHLGKAKLIFDDSERGAPPSRLLKYSLRQRSS